MAEDALAGLRAQSWQPRDLIRRPRGDFSTSSSLPSWRQPLGPACCQTELLGPTAAFHMLGHGQATSRRSRAPRKTPQVWSDWTELTSRRLGAHFDMDSPGWFLGHILEKAALPLETGRPGGGPAAAGKQISMGVAGCSSRNRSLSSLCSNPAPAHPIHHTCFVKASTILTILLTACPEGPLYPHSDFHVLPSLFSVEEEGNLERLSYLSKVTQQGWV